ncbi:hypothetical protein FCOIX_4710 [Fusarium coicis]|nr:hypothetical protein FCOIX_4710 [Fusarium coicis]
MFTSSSNSSFTFADTSSSGRSLEANASMLVVPPLTHDCDYRAWVGMVKANFRMRHTLDLIENEEGPGVRRTKRDKATREMADKKERTHLLDCCLGPKVRKYVLLFPLTKTVRQIWYAIRKEIEGLNTEEQYGLLLIFMMQSCTTYPSTEEFLDAIDDRYDHHARHFPFPLPNILKLVTALQGTKNHDGMLYTGFWKSLNGDEPTYPRLKEYVEREAEADCNLFDTIEKAEDAKPMLKLLSKCKGKS